MSKWKAEQWWKQYSRNRGRPSAPLPPLPQETRLDSQTVVDAYVDNGQKVVIYACPICHFGAVRLEHKVTYTCPICATSIKALGNHLDFWWPPDTERSFFPFWQTPEGKQALENLEAWKYAIGQWRDSCPD